MKKGVLISIILFTCMILWGFTIPFSATELKDSANHLSELVRVSPDDSVAIPLRTDVWLWHDEHNLYMLMEAEIDDTFEQGILGRIDGWSSCDYMRFQVITDKESYNAYFFYSFPLGNQLDGIRKSDLNLDSDWDSNYETDNTVSGNMWRSLMSIPFKDLRFYGDKPYSWKIILTRYFADADEYYSFPYSTTDMGKDYFRVAYDVIINEELEKARNYRLTSYYIKKYNLEEKTVSYDPENVGIDFSYNQTTAVKVKMSVNPDYSDVPLDSVQDNFNIRYAPSYYENRYFFIEDLDVFDVGSELFYSRHIMQPQYAVKLTGNAAGYSYGFLSAMDKEVSEDGEIVNSADFYNMAAFKPKWEKISIQFTLLNRMKNDYHNEVLLINPQWDINKDHSLWCSTNLSVKEDDLENKKGYQLACGYEGRNKKIYWEFNSQYRSKGYRADMGLVYETGYSGFNASLCYISEPKGIIIKKLVSSLWASEQIYNDTGELLDRGCGGTFFCDTQDKVNFSLSLYTIQNNYEGSNYVCNNLDLYLGYSNISWLTIYLNYYPGNSLIYSAAKISADDTIILSVYGNIGNNMSYYINTQRQRYFDIPEDCQMDNQYWLGNIDITYNFSNQLSFKNGLRYNNYETGSQSAWLGFFTNLSYEFKDNCNIYFGYKTVQDEIEQEYIIDYRQAYIKVSYTF